MFFPSGFEAFAKLAHSQIRIEAFEKQEDHLASCGDVSATCGLTIAYPAPDPHSCGQVEGIFNFFVNR